MESQSASPQQYRVLADYDVNDPHPLRLEAGEPVEVVRTDDGWPGWVWIRSGEQAGWIPASHIGDSRSPACRTVRKFDGSDLSARRGDIVTAIESESGWILASDSSGATGWFPLFNLRPVR